MARKHIIVSLTAGSRHFLICCCNITRVTTTTGSTLATWEVPRVASTYFSSRARTCATERFVTLYCYLGSPLAWQAHTPSRARAWGSGRQAQYRGLSPPSHFGGIRTWSHRTHSYGRLAVRKYARRRSAGSEPIGRKSRQAVQAARTRSRC